MIQRLPIPVVAAVVLAVALAAPILPACTADDPTVDDPTVAARDLDLGGAEVFGPVRVADLAGVLSKCMGGEQQAWLVYADDGPHFDLAITGEATQESTGCVLARLLQLGLVELPDATTGGGSCDGTASTG
jgi:hypothetical protein